MTIRTPSRHLRTTIRPIDCRRDLPAARYLGPAAHVATSAVMAGAMAAIMVEFAQATHLATIQIGPLQWLAVTTC